MLNRQTPRVLFLCIINVFIPLVLTFSWELRSFFRPALRSAIKPISTTAVKRISHQAASDPKQDIILDNAAWYDTDGTPLFYSAWRARPGPLSPEPKLRSTLIKHGARVACWPSSGGVWIKHADVVDMEFLGLNRFRNTPRQFDQTAEDKFCATLKLVGPDWWSLPPDFQKRKHLESEQYACDTLETCFPADIQNKYLLAWPESTTTACYVSIAQAEQVGGDVLRGFRNAVDMEERCDVIVALGGTVCPCRPACTELEFLDWSFRDPGGENGCSDPPLIMGEKESFDPVPTREVLDWANGFCRRNGWKKGANTNIMNSAA